MHYFFLGVTRDTLCASLVMRQTRSPADNESPSWTSNSSNLPQNGLLSIVSIFIAEKIHKGSPTLTSEPALTRTSTTVPDMGAPTSPGRDKSALGLTLCSTAMQAQPLQYLTYTYLMRYQRR